MSSEIEARKAKGPEKEENVLGRTSEGTGQALCPLQIEGQQKAAGLCNARLAVGDFVSQPGLCTVHEGRERFLQAQEWVFPDQEDKFPGCWCAWKGSGELKLFFCLITPNSHQVMLFAILQFSDFQPVAYWCAVAGL